MIVPSWPETLVGLHSAETLEDLWRVLLMPHGVRSVSAWDEPFELFRQFHCDDATDAAMTALLLCSDHRWRKASHPRPAEPRHRDDHRRSHGRRVAIDPNERAEAIGIGVSGSRTVRLAAVHALAELEGAEVARQTAQRDVSIKVRAWADKPRSELPGVAPSSDEPPAPQRSPRRSTGGPNQPSLF
jgi:hypothetical protein